MNLLVCDVDKSIQRCLSRSFQREGRRVYTAHSEAECSELLLKESVDLAIMNIRNPNVDRLQGLSALSHNKDLTYALLIIPPFEPLPDKIISNQFFFDFISTPIEEQEIINRIRRFESWMCLQGQSVQHHLPHIARLANVGSLSAFVDHEINNPLTFISGNAELLDEMMDTISTKIEGESKESSIIQLLQYAPNLLKAVKRGSRRISEIVTFLSSISNSTSLEKKTVTSIQDCILNASNFLGLCTCSSTVEFSFKSTPETEFPKVHISRQSFTLAVLSVLLNAKQETHGLDHALIAVNLVLHEQEIVLSIEDNGKGFSDADIDKVFEPFFSTKDDLLHPGLGLFVARAIVVNDHGGSIYAESSCQGGARILITLPKILVANE